MATSGSRNFTQTRIELLQDAFQLIGVYGIGRTISAEDAAVGNRFLNKMIKAWSAQGLHLWEKSEGVLFVNPYQASYKLGNASADDKATSLDDLVLTQNTNSLAANATAVTVTSTSGMAVADYIGIVLSDNTIHWTTIATIPTSTTLTLTVGVTVAATASALVYTFTNKIYKPLRVLNCRIRQGIDLGSSSTETDLPLTSISHSEYFNLPVKSSGGISNQFHYSPKLENGVLYLYPRPVNGNYRIHFTYESLIEDLDNASDNFDFPAEWLEAITYQLAIRLGSLFGKSERAAKLAGMAGMMLDNLMAWDTEISSVHISPDGGFTE